MEQWLTQVQIVQYFGVEAQITNIRQSQKGEPSWGAKEEFLPKQGNGSVSLPPIMISNTWQEVSLQIQYKITLKSNERDALDAQQGKEQTTGETSTAFMGRWSGAEN